MRGRLDPAQLDDRIEQLGAPLDRRRPVLAALSVAITLLLVVGLFAAVREEADALGADEAAVSVAGEALVRRAGANEVRRLADGATVSSGDEIEVVDGTVVLTLTDGTTLEGRATTGERRPTELRFGAVPSLQRGQLLVVAPAGYVVQAAGTVIELDDAGPSAARLTATLQVEVAAYEGLVHVDSAGRTREVPALRQLTVSSLGRPASTPDPLRYEADDPWDRRFLGAAIDLGRRLDAFERAATAAVPPATAAAPTYRRLLPDLNAQPEFLPELLDSARDVGEVLVGAAIVIRGEGGSFASRWEDTFAFRDAGAEWGLVALDQGADFGAVVSDIEAAIAIATAPLEELAVPPPPPLVPPVPPGPNGDAVPPPAAIDVDPGPVAPPPPVGPAPTTPAPAPAPTLLPPVGVPLPPPTPETNLLGNLIEPVDNLIGILLGG